MSVALNRETGDHTKPVEKKVSIQIGMETHSFSVWCNRYVFDKLTRDDWTEAGRRLRDHVTEERKRMAMAGTLFLPEGPGYLRRSAERAMNYHVYEIFKTTQRAAGNLEWQVDALLAGQEYRV